VKAQVASKSQLLAIMSRKQHELEGRLDDMLTRITKETQEIKDLEQQLTDGQIAANEALKRDLEDIISGLQEYLHGVNEQARRARSDCLRLQRANSTLERLLQDKEQQLGQLQEAAQNSEARKEVTEECFRKGLLVEKENSGLRRAQGRAGAYEAELQAQLREKAPALLRPLPVLRCSLQLEHSALQAEFQKERQAKESTLAQLQLAAEREMGNSELLQQLATLQKGELMDKVEVLQNDLRRVRRELLCPDQVIERLDELRRTIASGPGVLRYVSTVLERAAVDGPHLCLRNELQSESFAHGCWLGSQQYGKWLEESELAGHSVMLFLYELPTTTLTMMPQLIAGHHQVTKKHEEAELIRLREGMQEQQEQQYLVLQRLQETESERDRLLTELVEQDKQLKAEETQTQEQLQSMDLELQELRRSFTASDLRAADQLKAAKHQLRSLHSTVQKIGQERAEVPAAKQPVLFPFPFLMRVDNSENLEELLEEIEALRGTLLQHSNYLSRCSEVPRSRGYWYYVPPYQNVSYVASFKLIHYSSALPEPPYGDSYGESDEDGDGGTHFTPPPGSVIYTMPPDGTPLPQGTVIYAPPLPGLSVVPGAVFYGPPPEGARLVYGPPPSSWAIPLIPTGTLLCNMPGHQDTVSRPLMPVRASLWLGAFPGFRKLLESPVSQTEEEQDVACLEKTLQKRKVQLREADHLLLELEAALKDTTAKVWHRHPVLGSHGSVHLSSFYVCFQYV
uniref:Centriolin n=1 Tax=Electrophorus electricus TaxID=8005 RepID=A0A4W4HMA7_ELEEL